MSPLKIESCLKFWPVRFHKVACVFFSPYKLIAIARSVCFWPLLLHCAVLGSRWVRTSTFATGRGQLIVSMYEDLRSCQRRYTESAIVPDAVGLRQERHRWESMITATTVTGPTRLQSSPTNSRI